MHLVRYAAQDEPQLGVMNGDRVVSIEKAVRHASRRRSSLEISPEFTQLMSSDPKVLLAAWPAVNGIVGEATAGGVDDAVVTHSLDEVGVLPFVPNPEKVIGVSYNYKTFSEQENIERPDVPQVFSKMPGSITGAYDVVNVPAGVMDLDFEAELCVVVGRTCRNASVAEARGCIAGYTVMNELTAKILPRPETDLETIQLRLKGGDNLAPLGAVVVTADEVPDWDGWRLTCKVNGEVRQDFPVDDWYHEPAEALAFLSTIMTMRAGDLMAMGTSSGVGIADVPPRLLKEGDSVEIALRDVPGTKNVVHFTGPLSSNGGRPVA